MNLLDFDKETLATFVNNDCKLPKKLKNAFTYVTEKLGEQKVNKVSKLKWLEGKNYDWAVLKNDCVIMLIRKYRDHFTIYSKFTHPDKDKFYENDFSIFTYESDRELMTDNESDERCDNNYIDIDTSIESIFKLIKEGHSHLLWNDCAVTMPKHSKIKVALIKESIYSFDLLIFAAEEIANIQVSLYAENEMLEMLKKLKVGDSIGRYKIKSISTKVENGYYHDSGVYLDENKSFKDVYCLTMYYLNDVLKAISL